MAFRNYLRIVETLCPPVSDAKQPKWFTTSPALAIGRVIRVKDDPVFGSFVAVVERVEKAPNPARQIRRTHN